MYNDSLFNAFARSYEARSETDMSMAEYLESCRSDPMRYANAAERLLARIEAAGAIKPRQQILEVLLAVRASTGSPASGKDLEKPMHKDQLTSRAPPGKAPHKIDSITTPQGPKSRRKP